MSAASSGIGRHSSGHVDPGQYAASALATARQAGGRVEGAALRVSLSWFNYDDLDLHVHEPPGRGVNSLSQHIYFRMPTSVDIRNNASTKLGPGLDIRGEGGQVLAAPTIHTNGKPYAWESGYGPDEIAVADPPAWLAA